MKAAQLSWGRFPYYPQQMNSVHWPDNVSESMAKLKNENDLGTLAFGMGRSYGDSCLAASDHVLSMRDMNRILFADWETGLIVAQAGLTFDELIRVVLPRGWFLPVTPGTRYVTLGGAVANDVHGKNHQTKGTLGCHVRQLTLYRSDQGEVTCSPNENLDLFAATVGGLGLTGVILSVALQLRKVTSNKIEQRSIKFEGLDEFFNLSQQFDSKHEYNVAWIDCLAKGKQTGRGHYIIGDHAVEGSLECSKKTILKMPFDPPISLINHLTLKTFNALYYHRQSIKSVCNQVDYAPFFYPLDGMLHWNKIYGKGGFQQYQCVVPRAQAQDVIRAILQEIALSGTGSFLAVLKQFGDRASPGLLSFPMPGTTLALDFPQSEPSISRLFLRLDQLVHEAGGRLYPAKDAHMSESHFKQAYPSWHRVEALRDPKLLSRFWQRVTQ
jgi:FAD/FMN-containing dehydrogenase